MPTPPYCGKEYNLPLAIGESFDSIAALITLRGETLVKQHAPIYDLPPTVGNKLVLTILGRYGRRFANWYSLAIC